MRDDHFYERYHRQLILEGFGMAAQEKLAGARVLIAGAGGLGCPALLYLAGAGVGKIGIVDEGMVELSNLHRQVLYSVHDIGKSKVECARRALNRLNPEVEICPLQVRLNSSNCLDVVRDYDIVIDGLDNFQTKYLLNDACALLLKPLIYGAITRFEGQVSIFNVPSPQGSVNYRDLYPRQPGSEETMSCNEAGVLGILPGIIGSFQAAECIKLITGIGVPLVNKLLTYNALTSEIYTIGLSPSGTGSTLIPRNEAQFSARDDRLSCAPGGAVVEIDSAQFCALIKDGEAVVVDVRGPGERPVLKGIGHLQIPLPQLSERHSEIKQDTVVFVCQSGQRSLTAASRFSRLHPGSKDIYSLKGGVNGLKSL
jgi:adenylyltransferase/sulfurtransferase